MHLLSDFDLSKNEIDEILTHAQRIKANPEKYGDAMKNKTLIMLFELASLRTRISFEAGMNLLGGGTPSSTASRGAASRGARRWRTG